MPHIHHVNCATMCPPAARVGSLVPSELVGHCLVVEGNDGLVLVDTGFGTDDVAEKGRRLGRAFTAMVGPRLSPEETMVARLHELGHAPQDVSDIVLTHLDLDHAGGLADFPHARVHVHTAELSAARNPTLRERSRYVQAQWAHGPRWVEHTTDGDEWFGFSSVRAVGEDILLVPLHGHSRGHCGVAVRRPDGNWLLHAGDAYFYVGDKETPRSCPPGLRFFQVAMQVDGRARRQNLTRLQELYAGRGGEEVLVFSAHDRREFEVLAAERPGQA